MTYITTLTIIYCNLFLFSLFFSVKKIMTSNFHYEFKIRETENGFYKISQFEEENLFMNIYFLFRFQRFLSPYCKWGKKAIRTLEINVRRKWVKRDLCNVDYFVDLVKKTSPNIDPTNCYFDSEDYFIKLMFLKPFIELLYYGKVFKKREKKNPVKTRKMIR